MVIISLWTPLAIDRIAERWFTWPNMLYLSPSAAADRRDGVRVLARARRRAARCMPFLAAVALFLLGFIGLAISTVPYLVPPTLTFWDAAAVPRLADFHAGRRRCSCCR